MYMVLCDFRGGKIVLSILGSLIEILEVVLRRNKVIILSSFIGRGEIVV